MSRLPSVSACSLPAAHRPPTPSSSLLDRSNPPPSLGPSDHALISKETAFDRSSSDQRPVTVPIEYARITNVGSGSFGVVFSVRMLQPSKDTLAIKRVLQDKRYKNRELDVMKAIQH